MHTVIDVVAEDYQSWSDCSLVSHHLEIDCSLELHMVVVVGKVH